MMNTENVNMEDDNAALLLEQVMAQMVGQSIATGTISKQQVVVMLEDMIQQVERGTLSSTLDGI